MLEEPSASHPIAQASITLGTKVVVVPRAHSTIEAENRAAFFAAATHMTVADPFHLGT